MIGPITLFDPSSYPTRFAGEVADFDLLQWLDKKDVKKCGLHRVRHPRHGHGARGRTDRPRPARADRAATINLEETDRAVHRDLVPLHAKADSRVKTSRRGP
jgi:hypothetical protein